jgi:hypothetical protein
MRLHAASSLRSSHGGFQPRLPAAHVVAPRHYAIQLRSEGRCAPPRFRFAQYRVPRSRLSAPQRARRFGAVVSSLVPLRAARPSLSLALHARTLRALATAGARLRRAPRRTVNTERNPRTAEKKSGLRAPNPRQLAAAPPSRGTSGARFLRENKPTMRDDPH